MNRRNTPSTRKKNQIDTRQPASSRQGSGSIRSTQSAAIKGVALTIGYRDHAVCERLHFTVPKGAVSVLAPRDALCKAALLDLLTGGVQQQPAPDEPDESDQTDQPARGSGLDGDALLRDLLQSLGN